MANTENKTHSGDLPVLQPLLPTQFVNEKHLLDLEHEVFLSLCSEPATHAMIESTLKKGKK